MRTILNNALKVLSPQERNKLVKLILLDFLVSVLDIFFLAILLYVVTFYTQANDGKMNHGPAAILKQYPLLLITAFFVLFILKNFTAYSIVKSQYNFVYSVASRVSKSKLTEYLRGDYSNYVEIDSSVHIHRINQQPIEFCHYVLKGILQLFSQSLLLLISLSAILLFNAQLFLLLFILLVPPVLLVGHILKKKLHTARTHAKASSEKSLQHLQEALSGYVESKIYRKEAFFTGRYHEQQDRLNKYLSDQQTIQNIPSRVIEVFAIFGLFILILLSSLRTGTATVQLITIGAFVAASYKIIPGLVKIMNSLGQVKTYAHTCNDLRDSEPNNAGLMIHRIPNIHSFELSKISFDYKNVQVLNNFSMKLKQGDFLGMSGASGKGKTTILNLLLGFISPVDGSIFINDIENMKAQLCWKNISYVKQQPFLINDTVRANITLHATSTNDQKLLEVIHVTGVDRIAQMSQKGLDTLVTEHGKNLSGGQRQRIALARALYKDFDLLVLDEPFSELDEASEIRIMSYLQVLSSNGKMVVLITHNKKALSFCNKTVSMDEYN